MGNLQGKHYAVLGGLFASIGMELVGVKHGWADVLTTTFVGSLFIQIGTVFAALYTGAPRKEWDGVDRRGFPAATPAPSSEARKV